MLLFFCRANESLRAAFCIHPRLAGCQEDEFESANQYTNLIKLIKLINDDFLGLESVSRDFQHITGKPFGIDEKESKPKEVRFGLFGNKIAKLNISDRNGKLVLITGKRGFGKSVCGEVFECGYFESGYKIFRIDIEGEAISNRKQNLKDAKTLELYNNTPIGLPIRIYAPYSKKRYITDTSEDKAREIDVWFKLPKYLTLSDYNLLLQVTPYMERKIKNFYEEIEKEKDRVSIDDIIDAVECLKKFAGKEHFLTRLVFIKSLISEDESNFLDLEKIGNNLDEITVFDMSVTEGEDVTMKGLVTWISQKIYSLRENDKILPSVIMLDEAHRFITNISGTSLDKDFCTKAMLKIAKQGRKRQLHLILLTQSISDIHDKIFSEVDCYIIFRLNNISDLKFASDSLGSISKEHKDSVPTLPKWTALVVMENKSMICKISPPPCQHKF